MQDFVHLHVHSHYSILDGQASIQKLVDKAIKDGMRGIAITDHGNMFGIKEFWNYVKKKNGANLNDAKELYIYNIMLRKNPAHNQVIHYIVRYGLTHEHALLIESVLIDIFNHKLNIDLNSPNGLTNIYGGFYSYNGCITSKSLLQVRK